MEKLTLRKLLRLFYRHMVDFIPVVDEGGSIKGALLKSKVVSLTGGDIRDLDQGLSRDVILFLMDDINEAKSYIYELLNNGELKLPVVTTEGDLSCFWTGAEFMEALGGRKAFSPSLLFDLLEKIPFALGIFNESGEVVYSNSLFKRNFEREEMLIWHRDRIKENIASLRNLSLSFGGKKWEGISVPLGNGGRVGLWAFLWEDITVIDNLLFRASKLAGIHRSFERLMDFINEGIWCVDAQGKVIFSNKSFEQLSGVKSLVGKLAQEVFGDSWSRFPIYRSLKEGREFSGLFWEGKRCLKRMAFPVKVGDETAGAMELVSLEPSISFSETQEWLELGEVTRTAFSMALEAFKEGSVFIWGDKGTGKTLLGLKLLEGLRDVVVLKPGYFIGPIREDTIIFVENLDSFTDEERSSLIELIREHKSVVTSRLPLACFSPFLDGCFKDVLYLPPLLQRWDEAENFLKEKFPDIEVTKTITEKLKKMNLKENFRSLLEMAENEFSLGGLKAGLTLKEMLEEKEREIIKEVFSYCNGNVSKTAKLLGIPRQTLQYKLKKFKIKE
ncbi:MAG: PAS domain-containing protein [Synergistetes bacterium]|nr:PAS domain-containing protein [Synergistota bacterium]